jgi:hypothetical protein
VVGVGQAGPPFGQGRPLPAVALKDRGKHRGWVGGFGTGRSVLATLGGWEACTFGGDPLVAGQFGVRAAARGAVGEVGVGVGEHAGEVGFGAAGHGAVKPLGVFGAGDQRDTGGDGAALSGVGGGPQPGLGATVPPPLEGVLRPPAGASGRVAVQAAADGDAAVRVDCLDAKDVAVGDAGPVVVAGDPDHIPSAGALPVGDLDLRAGREQAQWRRSARIWRAISRPVSLRDTISSTSRPCTYWLTYSRRASAIASSGAPPRMRPCWS